jgi:hypothetical protein
MICGLWTLLCSGLRSIYYQRPEHKVTGNQREEKPDQMAKNIDVYDKRILTQNFCIVLAKDESKSRAAADKQAIEPSTFFWLQFWPSWEEEEA